jgi:L-aspartate oxidase
MTATLCNVVGAPVIVGGGIAGLMTALSLAPMPVILVTKAPLETEASSAWAQGGIAAAVGPDDDLALHLADTLAAGDGLCDASVAKRITRSAPAGIETLLRHGVRFDRDSRGALLLGLEAAHSRRRIVHATGDGAGKEIMRAPAASVRSTASVTVLEGFEVHRLQVGQGTVSGLIVISASGTAVLPTNRVVLATGGLGGLFCHTTNPRGAFGQGLALAAQAGAALIDMEFVQFHPTALDINTYPVVLVTEAVRGEGAVLIDETGSRFMADIPGRELAPRDVVARAIWRQMAKGHRTFLDTRTAIGDAFTRKFPVIAAACATHSIDPVRQPIPVRPAAHYHVGGIATDEQGRSTLPGLWACGEVACTGLHGANRLASNSLLEAVVCAGWVADSVRSAGSDRVRPQPEPGQLSRPDPEMIRPILSRAAGILRDRDGLEAAIAALLPLARSGSAASDPALVALFIAVAALRRQESRGGHFRSDFPRSDPVWRRRCKLTLEQTLAVAREVAG